jgi:hypothetical protein
LLTSKQKTRWSLLQRSRLAQCPKATPPLVKAKRRLLECASRSEQVILSIRFNETIDVTRRGSPRRVFFRLFRPGRVWLAGQDGPTQS